MHFDGTPKINESVVLLKFDGSEIGEEVVFAVTRKIETIMQDCDI